MLKYLLTIQLLFNLFIYSNAGFLRKLNQNNYEYVRNTVCISNNINTNIIAPVYSSNTITPVDSSNTITPVDSFNTIAPVDSYNCKIKDTNSPNTNNKSPNTNADSPNTNNESPTTNIDLPTMNIGSLSANLWEQCGGNNIQKNCNNGECVKFSIYYSQCLPSILEKNDLCGQNDNKEINWIHNKCKLPLKCQKNDSIDFRCS